jgi:S-adenosylmethionine-diacylgycerolhomoserine-N-methlytransferase
MQTVFNDAARMDRHYRYQRHIYDATRTRYLIGRMPMLRLVAPPPDGHVLEIACGTAWNLVRAARLYPGVHLYGLDVSTAMLETAGHAVVRAGLQRRIRLAQGDATMLDTERAFGRLDFDRVFISYALSMIPGWRQALSAAERVLGPEGELHIVDFGQCERLPRWVKSGIEGFLAHYTVSPRVDLEAELARLADERGLKLQYERWHRGYTCRAVLRRQ